MHVAPRRKPPAPGAGAGAAALRERIDPAYAALVVGAATLTAVAALLIAERGASLVLGGIVAAATFAAVTLGFAAAPHVTAAVMVPYLVVLPTLIWFVSPSLGVTKDLIVLAAVLAAAGTALQSRDRAERERPYDLWLVSAVLLLGLLYLANLSGGHDAGWFHGFRLVVEPLALLLAALVLPEPRRTFRWVMASLIATGAVVAAYGLYQATLGYDGLVGLGYEFGEQIQIVGGDQVRSFGPLGEPFSYAAVLLLALAATMFWLRDRRLQAGLIALLGAGLAVSYVRSAVLIVAALLVLWLLRRGWVAGAAALATATVVAGLTLLVAFPQHLDPSSETGETPTLNGRTEIWAEAIGPPSSLALGRGVGEVGQASVRASGGFGSNAQAAREADEDEGIVSVDSGYVGVVVDVGLLGLALLLAVLARLAWLSRQAIRASGSEGWVAAAFLAVLVLDALTRITFTQYPTAYLGLFVIGLALAAAGAPEGPDRRTARAGG